MPVVEYIVNYDYISTVLCVNVDKPILECNGKCYVAKELQQVLDSKSPIQIEKAVVLFDFIPVFSYNFVANMSLVGSVLKETVSMTYSNFYTYLFSTIVLQPPIL
nr:hypothetical protein [Myroides oncorhynchi]